MEINNKKVEKAINTILREMRYQVFTRNDLELLVLFSKQIVAFAKETVDKYQKQEKE